MSAGTGKFGSCCEIMKDVLEIDEFEPLIAEDASRLAAASAVERLRAMGR